MGLDCYVYKAKLQNVIDDETVSDTSKHCKFQRLTLEEVYYWRKNYVLHNFFEEIYREKFGDEEEFNCKLIRIRPVDIDNLKLMIFNRYDDIDTLREYADFFKKAKKQLKDGFALFYEGWY